MLNEWIGGRQIYNVYLLFIPLAVNAKTPLLSCMAVASIGSLQ